MDATFGVSLGDRRQPLPSLAGADRMRVRVSLDFGGEGYFPLADEMARSSFLLLVCRACRRTCSTSAGGW